MTIPIRQLRSCALLLLAACSAPRGGTGQADKAPSQAARAAERVPAPARAESAAPSAPVPLGVFYDLLKHRAHAELRFGDTLLLDFGAPGDAKYTLGGWGTHVRRGAELAGASTAFVSGTYGDLLLPVQARGAQRVHMRVRAPRDGKLLAYFDDKLAAQFKGKPGEFSSVSFALSDTVAPGEHMLRLRGSGMARLGADSTALALDWISVGPEEQLPSAWPDLRAAGPALALSDGFALGYTFKVPPGARLQAAFDGDQAARLTLLATDDALAAHSLGEYPAGQVDLDLSGYAGRVIRLDLRARGALSLTRAQVAVPRPAEPAAPRPVRNVVVYLIDTLRADHLKPFNAATRVQTPGLDELVQKGGAVFTSAHTQENWTKPSVASLLSSLLPWEHLAVTTEAVVPNSVELLPERLAQFGFYSGAFIANGYVSDKFGFRQGWDTYRNYIREGRYSRAEFLAADVLAWLDKRPKKKPFFLYVHAIDPHVPYKPTARFLSVYDPMPYKGVVDFSSDATLLEKIKLDKIKLNARDKQHLEALYDSEISYHDVHFHSILNALETRGLAEDTMVVVVADHGEEFWDHGSVGHGHSVYEELLHIPMVIRVPGVTASAQRIDSSSALVDIVPTVFEALGKPLPAGLSGRSLLPELRGARDDAPPGVVSGFMDDWRTLVIGDLKLIQRGQRHLMLHDLASDPHEQSDLAGERPITTRYLRGQLGLRLAGSQPSGDRPARKGQTTTIDAATEAQLRALGYVDGSRR